MATSSELSPTAVSGPHRAQTLCEAFQATAARSGDAPALRTPRDGVVITWAQYAASVREIAAGLAAHGVGRGDTVALMLSNRPEHHLIDTAALHLGATPFSVYSTSSPEQLEYLLTHARSTLIVTERQFLDRVIAARERVPTLQYVFVVEGASAGTADLAELVAAGEPAFDFESAWRTVTADDTATLIYTSGTTGPPKGVELSHHNLLWTCRAWLEVTGHGQDGRLMSYLPMAHLADRVFAHYLASINGGTITCVADPKQAVPAVADCHPTLWLGVPRVWEKLQASLEAKFAADPDEGRRAMIARAVEAGVQRVRLEQSGTPVPDELRRQTDNADAEIFAGLRGSLGFDQNPFLLSGAAPIPLHVLEFFGALGLPINEGYGMTETSAVVTLNGRGGRRFGTVGRPLPGVEVALASDGELLVRGPLIMAGYRDDPDKTAEAIDTDGWLHTGDVAAIDADGYVRIVDRKKELIINAAGKNMSPANIEAAVKSGSPLIGQVCCIGDQRPYNTALIVLEPEATAAFVADRGLTASSAELLVGDPQITAEVAGGVARANDKLSRVEQIKKYTIIASEWLPGGDELTPTLKLKRRPIEAKYAAEIAAMYAS